ncbi:hypothetical protein BJX64DRAFT_252399 [Aspergillus heterothallicus]
MGPVFTNRDIPLLIALAPLMLISAGVSWTLEISRRLATIWQRDGRRTKEPEKVPRRPLTPPLSDDDNDDNSGSEQGGTNSREIRPKRRRTYSQSQSVLFNLPLKIRLMIYAEILTFQLPLMIEHREAPGNRLRSDRLYPKLVGRALANLSLSESKVYFNWLWKSRGWPLCGLLACCRRVYSESTLILYQSNTLAFNNPLRILDLPRSILPSRLQTIRSIQLEKTLHEPWRDGDIIGKRLEREALDLWRKACAVLAEMKGMQKLVVYFSSHDYYAGGVDILPYLQAMADIGVSEFVVYTGRGASVRSQLDLTTFRRGLPLLLVEGDSPRGRWHRQGRSKSIEQPLGLEGH